MIDFTFGIITSGENDDMINVIIDSIEKQNIPNYEIIIVGGNVIKRKYVIHIPFDDNIRKMWITRKKNLITEKSIYENIVYMHDYIKLDDDWYDGYLKFGNDFNICMNKMENQDGSRFRDWTLWKDDLRYAIGENVTKENIYEIMRLKEYILPYNIVHLSKYMYISGAYWVVKRDVMLEFKLNDKLLWGQGEDIEWSRRVRQKYDFSINPNSIVRLIKNKKPIWNDCSDETIEILNKIK